MKRTLDDLLEEIHQSILRGEWVADSGKYQFRKLHPPKQEVYFIINYTTIKHQSGPNGEIYFAWNGIKLRDDTQLLLKRMLDEHEADNAWWCYEEYCLGKTNNETNNTH